ncbi:UNC5B [Branchiostoma lanceolatum]|uniref:Netrin receptor UNC5 n=1 Tax=Branchiostoma lanceolatum TaxID=7740 RepID=A0A8K0EVA5_BRALA|nr:UNC5B [Branchiostoma lanceolatum]
MGVTSSKFPSECQCGTGVTAVGSQSRRNRSSRTDICPQCYESMNNKRQYSPRYQKLNPIKIPNVYVNDAPDTADVYQPLSTNIYQEEHTYTSPVPTYGAHVNMEPDLSKPQMYSCRSNPPKALKGKNVHRSTAAVNEQSKLNRDTKQTSIVSDSTKPISMEEIPEATKIGTRQSQQQSSPNEPSTEEKVGNLENLAVGEDESTLMHLLSKFRDTVGVPNTIDSGKDNLSTLRFAAGVFDKRGGHLPLEHLGIDLYIPPDAVSDENTEIFLYAREVEEFERDEGGKKWTPPVIQCGPHGLTFNRHVILTVKHPAKDLTKWSFKFQASSTDIGETPDWKDLTQDPSAMCFAHEDKTVIFVDHFTLFNVTGELAGAKGREEVESMRFRMGIFAEPLFQDTEMFQLRVRFWQDNDKEEQRAQNKERQLGAMQLSDDKVLHLAGDGGNLSVVLEWLFPGWRVTSGDRQTISFGSLWNDYAEIPSCSFGLEREPTGPPPGRVACRVTALQAAHPGNSVSIDVLKQLRPRQSTDCENLSAAVLGPDLGPESTFLRLQPELCATPRCIPQFPDEEQFRRLCLELDLENPAGKDWRGVAEALHLPYDFIQWTGQKTDPTRRLLDFLVALHREDSLRVLRDTLAQIGHERALQMVGAMMGTSNNGPTTGMQYRAEQQHSSGQQPFAGMWHEVAMPSGSIGTVPKEVHSLSAYSPNKAESRSDIVNGEGPSKTQQAAPNGPTSSGSTTVEKVSDGRSLGDGQEADASMPSTRSVATGNTWQTSSEDESNNSITVPKTVQIQANGYYSDYSLSQHGILDEGRGVGQSSRSALSFRATPVAQK